MRGSTKTPGRHPPAGAGQRFQDWPPSCCIIRRRTYQRRLCWRQSSQHGEDFWFRAWEKVQRQSAQGRDVGQFRQRNAVILHREIARDATPSSLMNRKRSPGWQLMTGIVSVTATGLNAGKVILASLERYAELSWSLPRRSALICCGNKSASPGQQPMGRKKVGPVA